MKKYLSKQQGYLSPQTGRSMIEMLAVLAIMGVLAIGGIAAYSFAVSKHRANQIYNQADLRAVASFGNPLVRRAVVGETYPLAGFDEVVENITYQHKKTTGNGYDIIASHVPERVCRRLQDMIFPVPKSVTLNGVDLSSTCGSDNTFVFSYDGLSVGKPSSGVDPIDCNCSGCQSCESGVCQDNDNLCGPKEICQSGSCVCAPGYTECGGSCYTTCADGFMRDPVTCDCVCKPQDCPEHASWDSATCACMCEDDYEMCNGACHPVCDGSGMTGSRDPDTCACMCIEGTDAATCACPTGYIYVNGQCQRFFCTGENGACYINDIRCGTNCTNIDNIQTVSCQVGICRPSACPGELGESSFAYTNGKRLGGEWFWGCKLPLENWDCYWRGSNGYCFETGSEYPCAQTATLDGSKISGACQSDVCTNVGGTLYPQSLLASCLFDTGVYCYPIFNVDTLTHWECYSSTGVRCSNSCQNPPSCDGACDEILCSGDFVYDTEKEMCCGDEDVCCKAYATSSTCYREGTLCGNLCKPTGTGCDTGSCYDPGCPAGTTFGYISAVDRWGCIQGDMACSYYTQASSVQCHYKGSGCGTSCTYDGVCQNPILEECAPTDEETGKKYCIYGQPVTETCVCKGSQSNGYCCAAGHTYANGGCTLITCDDGQIADANGICRDACENNVEVTSTCVCSGTTHTDQFNRTICCDANHTWDETSQSCV